LDGVDDDDDVRGHRYADVIVVGLAELIMMMQVGTFMQM
jgi:hypothetical protein